MDVGVVGGGGGDEVVAVSDGLEEDEDGPEGGGTEGDEGELGGAVGSVGGGGGKDGEDEGEGCEDEERGELRVRHFDAEGLFAVGETAEEDADAERSGADDHDGGVDGVSWEGGHFARRR